MTNSLSELFRIIYSKFNIGRLFGTVVDPMLLLLVSRVRRRHDAWHKGLRITIVERKPGALNLNHKTVPRQDSVINMR